MPADVGWLYVDSIVPKSVIQSGNSDLKRQNDFRISITIWKLLAGIGPRIPKK